MTKPAPIRMTRTPQGLSPASAYDQERLDQYRVGASVEVTIRQDRSLPHHRLYWAILSEVVHNQEVFSTVEALHEAIKTELGYIKPAYRIDGTVHFVSDSISFKSMDEAQFNVFFDKAMDLICEYVIPGLDMDLLIAELKSRDRRAA